MNDTIEVSVMDLKGPALDYAVAIAEGMRIHTPEGMKFKYWYKGDRCVCPVAGYSPSESWHDGGPLIERHMLRVYPHVTTNGVVTSWAADMAWPCDTVLGVCGSTALVAACRLIVMKQLGPVVRVPKELIP